MIHQPSTITAFDFSVEIIILLDYSTKSDMLSTTDLTCHRGSAMRLMKWDSDRKDSDDYSCLLYTSPSPRDYAASRMPSSA